MKRVSGIALGVLAGIGGFVDAGGVITSSSAGAVYRYALLWTLVPGIVGFAVYADMSGRIAISTGRTTFDIIRDRLGARLALVPLVATTFVNVLTLVVEICGMALAVKLALQVPLPALAAVGAVVLAAVVLKVGFEPMDNAAAMLGLAMLVVVAATAVLDVHWGQVGTSLVHADPATTKPVAGYLFAGVSLLGAFMTPYQFEFYSSGALEQGWKGKDLLTNRASAIVGTLFGGVVTLGLMVAAAVVLYPHHQQVQGLADAALPERHAFGTAGVLLFGIGMFAVSAGAGLETALSGSYSLCQFFGWDWGKRQSVKEVPLFHVVILVQLVLAVLVVLTGVDPIKLGVVTMAFAAFALPFTFGPLLIVANDPGYVGNQRNTTAANVLAGLVLALLCVVTVATIPLLVLSGGGS